MRLTWLVAAVETRRVSTRGLYVCGLLAAILVLGLSASASRSFATGVVPVKQYEHHASSQHSIADGWVEVHGQKFSFDCSGTGSPTVVFEAGGGFDSTEWVDVQPEVAKTTRACAYDRLGEGLSGPVRPGVVQTVASQAETLRAVLDAARIEPPYVLVGHSWGGAIVQRFAFDYRHTVAGIVLVDSQEADVIGRWLAMLPRAPKSKVDPFAEVRAELNDALKPSLNPEHFDATASVHQLHELTSLGSLPLVVLTAGTSQIAAGLPSPYGARSYQIWLHAQSQLAALSSGSLQAVDTFSGHMIPTEDPRAVVAAVNHVVSAARRRGRLPRCLTVFRGIVGIHCS
jgi:pimeloyl-ACP methyl ester carboxylesterase